MPLSKKDKQRFGDEDASFGKKLKNIFSKGKDGPAEPHRNVPPPNFGPPPLHNHYRPPTGSPFLGPHDPRFTSQQTGSGYHSLLPPQASFQQYGQRNEPLRPGSAHSFRPAQANDTYRGQTFRQPPAEGRYLVPSTNFLPQQQIRSTSPLPPSEVVFVQVPKNNQYVDSDDDGPQYVYLVPPAQPYNRQHPRITEFNDDGDDYPGPHLQSRVPARRPVPRQLSYDSDDSDERVIILPAGRHPHQDSGRSTPQQRFRENYQSPPSRPRSPPENLEPETEPNLNRRFDYVPDAMVPFWYNKRPSVAPADSPSYLCATCRRIDLLSLFKQEESVVMPKPRDYIALGTLESILGRQNCGLCQLVARIVACDLGTTLPHGLDPDDRQAQLKAKLLDMFDESYFLCPTRFETTFRTPTLYLASSKDIQDASKQTSTQRHRGSMAIRPFHREAPNLGRMLMNPDQIDYEWIRERMRRCDVRDVGKLDYTLIQIRVIDVESLRVVHAAPQSRYVTLSYTWGNTKQVLMTSDNEASLRRGGLAALYDDIPKTIRDAITLTRRIGERYLWVDALCIRQDDEVDKNSQIQHMGDIYRHSILTICACCGEDANYGLPGIEPGTRETKQAAVVVGDIVVGNNVFESDPNEDIKWDTRAWTLQEKCLSQRKLQIYDSCVRWWCWHTITAEDENCRHTWWEEGTEHRGMHFFRTEHDLVVSKIRVNSNMDIYAFIVSDYSARGMTHQTDAEKALIGVWKSIDGILRGKFLAGLPDTEMGAALLWCPLGSAKRRLHPQTGRPLFPSWSWLGWVGHAAYPWLVERNMPMSEDGAPLVWRNALVDGEGEDEWFNGEDYRMNGEVPNGWENRLGRPKRWSVDDADGWTHIDKTDEGRRFLHPVLDISHRRYEFFSGIPQRLELVTLSASFALASETRVRPEKHDYSHKVHLVRVLDDHGFYAGYIYMPDPATLDAEGMSKYTGSVRREFIVLSRASTNPDPRMGEELLFSTPIAELHSVYSMSHLVGMLSKLNPADESSESTAEIDEKAHFDTRLYDATMPWGLFNVMMIETIHDISYRVAIGRIHVAAYMNAQPQHKLIRLE